MMSMADLRKVWIILIQVEIRSIEQVLDARADAAGFE